MTPWCTWLSDLRTTGPIRHLNMVAWGFGIDVTAISFWKLRWDQFCTAWDVNLWDAHHVGKLRAFDVASLLYHLCPHQGTYHPESDHIRFFHAFLRKPVEDLVFKHLPVNYPWVYGKTLCSDNKKPAEVFVWHDATTPKKSIEKRHQQATLSYLVTIHKNYKD